MSAVPPWIVILLKILDFLSSFISLYVGITRLNTHPELAALLTGGWVLRLPSVAYNIVREWRPPGNGGGGGGRAYGRLIVIERWVVVERRVVILVAASLALNLVAGAIGVLEISLLPVAAVLFVVTLILAVVASILIASALRQPQQPEAFRPIPPPPGT